MKVSFARGTIFQIQAIALALVFTHLCGKPVTAAERNVLSGHVPAAVAHSDVIQGLPRTNHLRLAIGLPLRNREQLESLIQQISDPQSSQFRHYLTPSQFAERFGPSQSDYDAVIKFAESKGLHVTGRHSNRMIVDVEGLVSHVENAFGVRMMSFRQGTRSTYYAPDREPSVELSGIAIDIQGLDNFDPPQPMSLREGPVPLTKPLVTGSGPAGLFIGNDFRAAYAPGVTLDGTGQIVGLLEFDGFYAADVQANFSRAGMTPVPTQTVLLNGFNGAPGGANIEVMLDIMMASYMAPRLSKVIVYEGYNPNDVLNRMATDNLAKQLSSSWGFGINRTTEQIFLQYIAQGQAFLQASGDSGAYVGGVMTPSDDPNVTVVGGTSLSTSGATGPWSAESTWSGSGGGISTAYTIPSYQQGLSMAASGGSTTMRNIPDVALTADIQMFLIQNNGQAVAVGGTSAAAPLWAGFIALANQQATNNSTPPVGFLNPALYTIGQGSDYQTDFHDIQTGSNGLSAVVGYDLATGWGSPAGQPLIDDLTNVAGTPSYTLSSSPSSLTIVPGTTGTAQITINARNGFANPVTLSTSGVPTGVTASFSAVSAVGTSTLSLVATNAAVSGNASIVVTGISGNLSNSVTIGLSVGTPGFTLTSSASNLQLQRSGTSTANLTVNPRFGFAGAVSLTASSLPSGVSASFTPATATSGSVVTFTASSNAVASTSSITITGTSGSLTSSVVINLTVTVPSFTLSLSPSTVTVPVGLTGSTAVNVVPINGFTGSVNLTASGLPNGLTATFQTATATSAGKVILTASKTLATGNSVITINGASGSLTASTKLNITVVAPSFTLATSDAGLSVLKGSSGTVKITVGAQNGFTGNVSLAVSGMPAGATASFNPTSTATTSTLTFNSGTAAGGISTLTITGTSGSLRASTTLAVTVRVPDFSLTTSAPTIPLLVGGSGVSTIRVVAADGFSGPVTLTATGMPTGVTATFSSPTATSSSVLTVTAGSTARAGSANLTITGVSSALRHTSTIPITVIVPSAGFVPLALSGVANVTGIVTDGSTFPAVGLDGGLNGVGTAYSATLLGAQKTLKNVPFTFGTANSANTVSNTTVPLPSGKFSTVNLLATAVNGPQVGQKFVVNYTDGTSTTFTQSLSDWFSPQGFAGESNALTMAYRDTSGGLRDNRTFLLYSYGLSINNSKQVSSITLPATRNVVVIALTLN